MKKQEWTESKIARYLSEGRGSGELENYKPWIISQNFASKGRNHRPKSWKTNRKMDLFSDLEWSYMYLLDWADNVIDIREQYPLERELTTKIAEKKNISHSLDRKNGTPIVMTTDMLITVKDNNKLKYIARTVKPSEELNNLRTIEKFEIEREYWEEQGINWGIVTEKDIPTVLWQNIRDIHSCFSLNSEELLWTEYLYRDLMVAEGSVLRNLDFFDRKYRLEDGSGLKFYKFLLARKFINVDMLQSIDFRTDVKNLTFTKNVFQEGENLG